MSATEAPASQYYAIVSAAGQIVGFGRCPAGMLEMQFSADGEILEVTSEEHDAILAASFRYVVVDGVLVERAAITPAISATSIAADGIDACVLSDLPNPCVVTVSGAVTAGPVEVTGGSVTLTSTVAGVIRVRIEKNPTHTRWEGRINAT